MKVERKKKVLWNSDFSKTKTGFGRNAKAVLKYLHDTGKYDLIEFACAPYTFEDKRLSAVPWKAYGSIPDDEFVRNKVMSNQSLEFAAKYGSFYLDEIIEKERPDCFIGVQDFWAFKEVYDKPWWNRINCALWITIDSLPIYSECVQHAHKIKSFWVWSKFAENEMKRLGFDHVETLHGAFDVSDFKPLEKRGELRSKYGLGDEFIFGFVFRNQPRKLIGTLLEAFSLYKQGDPKSNAKLLLHTNWAEGWSIESFIGEFQIDRNDILTTHVCTKCKGFKIKPYSGEGSECESCGAKKSVITPNGRVGIQDHEMNIVYNLIDFYIHPVTSGGLEMPMVESLLAGTPISTVNYSCGEEFCEQEFVTKIDHTEYREFGSQFRKSQPSAEHISLIMRDSQLLDLKALSKRGREWALKNFDLKAICKKIEEWIDSQPSANHDYEIKKIRYNDSYEFNKSIENDEQWAIDLIKNVFGYDESAQNDAVKKIVKKLKAGGERREFHDKSIEFAKVHNNHRNAGEASNFFKNDDVVDNVAFIAPPSVEDKIIVSKFFGELCKSENVYLVGVDFDVDFFSQFGKFLSLPKNKNTNDPGWLKNIKNEKGVKRFKAIYLKGESGLNEIENKQE